jgi:hypothetical protein
MQKLSPAKLHVVTRRSSSRKELSGIDYNRDLRPVEWVPIVILRRDNRQDRMSALGQKADISTCPIDVRFTPAEEDCGR